MENLTFTFDVLESCHMLVVLWSCCGGDNVNMLMFSRFIKRTVAD